MAIKRLHEGFGIGQDSCISGTHPMRPEDPPGLYLGRNPAALGEGLFITYWEACEIATKIGYPMPEVYEQQKAEIDAQAQEIAALQQQLQSEVHDLQLKAVSTEIKNVKKEILGALEDTLSAVRARVAPAGGTAVARSGAARVASPAPRGPAGGGKG